MHITEVNVTPINNEKKLKGFASIVFDNCFVVSDIKIIETARSAFLSMPSKKASNGKFRDVAHPLNAETRKMIENRVFDEYEAVTGRPLNREGVEGPQTEEVEVAVEETSETNVDIEMAAEDAVISDEVVSDESSSEEEEDNIEPSDLLSVKEFGY